jgi:hypothetical protein
MTTLTPPDHKQCQAEIPNGQNAFTLGGGHRMVRCTNAATFIVTEVEPGADGLCGSMSVCDECKAVLIKQMGPSIDKLAFVHIDAPIALDTIELFPGVQFRKDTSKPLGNQWMFEHEGHWLIAKLAYCDDISMDHLANVTRERDALALDAERYRWMRDCPWVGHMQAVGITALGDDTKWLSGTDADRAIDAAMAPAAKPDPGDDLLVVVIPGTEVMTPIARPWKEIAEPVADADRECHAPDCYNCEGTGRDPFNNGICTTNDNFPF